MLIDDGGPYFRGLLIDYDYAKDLNKERLAALLKELTYEYPVLPDHPNAISNASKPLVKPIIKGSQEDYIRRFNIKAFDDQMKARGVRTVRVSRAFSYFACH